MPNLQELLPFFQQLFQQWSELTLLNAPYAVTLALLVWLITAIGYSISIGFIKLRLARESKAKTDLQTSLDATQQQLQASQEQLLASNEQLAQASQQAEQNAQRASGLEQKLLYSNKQLTEGIAAMVEKFELLDHTPSLPAADADAVWQRFSAILGRVVERFQNEQQAKARLQLDVQAEKSKLADKDANIANLQGRLEIQAQKLADLQQAANEQQALQQELETLKQRLLMAQDKQRADSTRIQQMATSAADVQAASATVAVEALPRQTVTAAVAEAPVVQTPVVAEPVAAVVAPVVPAAAPEQPVAVAPSTQAKPAKAPGKLKGMFGNAMERFSKLDEKLGSPTTSKTQSIAEEPDEIVVEAAIEVVESQPVLAEAPMDAGVKQSGGFANKLGGMLGGLKKSPAKSAAEDAVVPEPIAAVVEVAQIQQDDAKDGGKKPGKLGGLLGKFKK